MCFSETNPLTTKAFYTLFIIHHLFRRKLFRCKPTTNIPFQFYQKTASPVKHWQNSDELLAMKNRFVETTNNGLQTIRVFLLSSFRRLFAISV